MLKQPGFQKKSKTCWREHCWRISPQEEKWDEALTNSQEKLAALADEALTEFEQGDTRPLEESL